MQPPEENSCSVGLPANDRERLEEYWFQFGQIGGNLSLALDQLTDILRLANQHTIYCRVERGPREGEPPPDVAQLIKLIMATKELVRDALVALKNPA
jgi:hypothetical protein